MEIHKSEAIETCWWDKCPYIGIIYSFTLRLEDGQCDTNMEHRWINEQGPSLVSRGGQNRIQVDITVMYMHHSLST